MSPPLDARDTRWERLLHTRDRFRGDVALYLENGRYSRVRIDDVLLAATRLSLNVTLLPTRGLYNERPPSWTVGGARKLWTFSEDLLEWSLLYIGTLFFEPGLLDAVVQRGENAPDEAYDRSAVNQCIRAYTISLLEPHLAGELGLFWRSRHVGRVTENAPMKRRWFVGKYPWVRGTFTPVDLDPDLERGLAAYADGFAHPERDEARVAKRLYAGWWLKTTQRALIGTLVPILDAGSRSIQWRFESLKAMPNGFEQRAKGLTPPRPDLWTVEEIQRLADLYEYGLVTEEEFAGWFRKTLLRLPRGTDVRPAIALLPDALPEAVCAALKAVVDEKADDEYRRR